MRTRECAALEAIYEWPLAKGLKFGDATRDQAMKAGERYITVGGTYIKTGKFIHQAGRLTPKGKTIRQAHSAVTLKQMRDKAGADTTLALA